MSDTLFDDLLRPQLPDAELEAAAQEMAMSYTYQTSTSNRCCN